MAQISPSGHSAVALCFTLTFSMLIFLTARLYTRKFIVKALGTDDIFLLLGAIVATFLLVPLFIGIYNYEFGYPQATARPSSIKTARLISYIYVILVAVCMGLTKVSLMLTVKRFARSNTLYIHIIHVLVAIVVISSTYSTFLSTFGCRPIRAAYETVGDGKSSSCPKNTAFLAIMILHIATDFLTLVLPMPLLCRVKIPVLQRSYLIFLLALGSVSMIAGIFRVMAIINATKHQTWDFLNLKQWMLAVVEADVAIICGCLPPLNAFVKHFFLKKKTISRSAIPPESMATAHAARQPSCASTLGRSSQHLNCPDDEQTAYNNSLDLELSSWETSSRRTTEGLCMDCVDKGSKPVGQQKPGKKVGGGHPPE